MSLGRCGEKVAHFTSVQEKPLDPKFGVKAYIRWLISKDDGAETYSMRLFRIDIGGRINGHAHPWEHEIFVIKGSMKVRIGSKWYRVSEGYFLYVPPNVEHEYVNDGNQESIFICVIPNKPTAEKKVVKC